MNRLPISRSPSENPARTIPCGRGELVLRRTPLVMGVVNVTPDSFSDGGSLTEPPRAVDYALASIAAGADIIDIGGESTRPGSTPVSREEELARVIPVIERLVPRCGGTPVSIDTRRAEVADQALRRGCQIVNDVTAAGDPEMVDVLLRHGAAVVLMHMKGDPRTMQVAPSYEDVVAEVTAYLGKRAARLVEAGVSHQRIVLDPGIGFGKRFRDNLEILNNVDSLRRLGYPVLIGASRKRFLGELLDADTDRRLPGSLAVAARCCQYGVEIVRVHDVRETVGLLRVLDAMEHPEDYRAKW